MADFSVVTDSISVAEIVVGVIAGGALIIAVEVMIWGLRKINSLFGDSGSYHRYENYDPDDPNNL